MNIHFIGIGGIGVSALAKYYLKKGWQVSGSDLTASAITEQMKDMGAAVHIGNPKASLVTTQTKKIIFSPAVPKDNVERIEARKKGIPEFSYPEALGELAKSHYTIAIAGTHGKSTTTAMLGLLLTKAKIDPTVIVGTQVKEFDNSNCRVGKSKYLVIEACEHFESFLSYYPNIIVITNIEEDHLDYYKNLKNILLAFRKFISHLPKNGYLVANKDDKNSMGIIKSKEKFAVKKYSILQKEAKKLSKILKLPGKHNVSNALSALTVARILKIPDSVSFKALSQFKGSWRRFEIFNLKTTNHKPYTLVSDYGHHPTEIMVTVNAAKEKWPKKKLWLVFQPHQYHRTYMLWNNFVKVLSRLPVDKLIIADIYDVAGREDKKIKVKISSEKLVTAIMLRNSKKGLRRLL